MIKLFLVEDETVIREGLKNTIPWEQYGYRFVGEAADGEMALPLIRQTRPDVLITDIKMPFMDGLSLCRIVAGEFPKMRIIIISGYDDFEYARTAIELGVEQYLLKPITKHALKKVLTELRDKIEQSGETEDYQTIYQDEMHEYEQFSRRRFFERVLGGELSVSEIYEEAAKASLEIVAPCYSLLFFYLREKRELTLEQREQATRQQDMILHYFLRRSGYILFRWNVDCYGVLVKAAAQELPELIRRAVGHIQRCCEDARELLDWYVATGRSVERLSMLPECYLVVNHCLAYRFLDPRQHILSEELLADQSGGQEEREIREVNPAQMDPKVIRDFLFGGSAGEIRDFVDSYLQNIRGALSSRIFRDYVVMNIRFAVSAYRESMGISDEEFAGRMRDPGRDMNMTAEDVEAYLTDMLETAFFFRNKESDYQKGKILRRALEYIDANFDQESLSLNSVSEEVGVSANYFSAIFSQSMERTFVEYVTAKRMEKARRLLKTTEKSSSEIAALAGYKDPHYFGFVFKKNHGMSPREYRMGNRA
ncbi:MAG: response regulator [Acetatifactor sp.]